MKIKCLKLINGEEVIGQFVDNGTQDVTLSGVSSIMMMPGQTPGQISLGLMPFLPYADKEEFTFPADKILIKFDPNMEMMNNYSRKHGAGIQVVSSLSM